MDKAVIAVMHKLSNDLTLQELCIKLGFDNEYDDKNDFDFEETLQVLNGIWMNIRKDLAIKEGAVYSLQDVIDLLLEEVKSITSNDNHAGLADGFYPNGVDEAVAIAMSNVQHVAAIYREHLSNIQEEEEIDDSETTVDAQDLHIGIKSDTEVVKIKHVRYEIKDGDLDLNPRWQRTVVWTPKKKKQLIRSLLLGIPLPSLIIFKATDQAKDDFGKQYVLDGKQRLTSITEFIAGTWALPDMVGSELIKPGGFRLSECSGKVWSNLPEGARNRILESKLAKITLEGLSNTELYNIFELYNTQGMKLNPAEIRNAAFHDNEIHRMVFDLVGEGEFIKDLIDDEKTLKNFQNHMRNVVGAGKEPKRYAAMDMIERYLGYSRSPNPQKQSTTNCIKNYYTNKSFEEDPKEVAKEVIECWNLASELYADIEDGAFKAKSGNNIRFHKLKGTTSMIIAKLLSTAITGNKITKEKAVEIVETLYSDGKCELPENQQTSSIWNYQAEVVCHLLYVMEDYKDAHKYVMDKHADFVEKMKDIYDPLTLF